MSYKTDFEAQVASLLASGSNITATEHRTLLNNYLSGKIAWLDALVAAGLTFEYTRISDGNSSPNDGQFALSAARERIFINKTDSSTDISLLLSIMSGGIINLYNKSTPSEKIVFQTTSLTTSGNVYTFFGSALVDSMSTDTDDYVFSFDVNNASIGSNLELGDLSNVNTSGADNEDVLTFNILTQTWSPAPSAGGSSPDWGDIGGTLSNQTDLQSELDGKQESLTLTTTGTSGAATLSSGTLNIPVYTSGGSGEFQGFYFGWNAAPINATPSSGYFSLNNGTPSSATTIKINKSSQSMATGAMIEDMKYLMIRDVSTGNECAYSISSITDNSTYYTLTVSVIGASAGLTSLSTGTEYNISFLTNTGSGSGVSDLSDLGDVNITSAANGDSLVYNSTTSDWENETSWKQQIVSDSVYPTYDGKQGTTGSILVQGMISTGVTSGGITGGNVIYPKYDSLNSEVRYYKASAGSSSGFRGVAMYVDTASYVAGFNCRICYQGVIANSAWSFSTSSIGKPVYLDPNTDGALTTTIPSTSGDFVQILGVVMDTDMIYFNPEMTRIQLT